MAYRHQLFDTLQPLTIDGQVAGSYYSLPQLQKAGLGAISRLPYSIRVVLESVLRNCDGTRITEQDVRNLAGWQPNAERTAEIPFTVARIVLQDLTGVPLLVDLAAMRSAAARMGWDPGVIEPLVPVDLVVDHSIQVDYSSSEDAMRRNMEVEFTRNRARYQFLKWGMQAFNGFSVVPPGIGIIHQVNLEYFAKVVQQKDGIFFPDTLVGTDSHTTMINGIGVVGWGVGGIEAEAGMLGQPIYFLTPDVVGVHLKGALKPGVTATDLVLRITEVLRAAKVVGKFVEYFGEGAASLSLTDRAVVANMGPEYGATMGYFGVDEETCRFMLATGRTKSQVDAVRAYFQAQGMFGIPKPGDIDYSTVIEIDLADVTPCVAGPKRPQDRIDLSGVKARFAELMAKPLTEGGYGKPEAATAEAGKLAHGDVVIASITSCTNTSAPSVMLAAGLLAKNAVEKGLSAKPYVKRSLAPGSRVVTDYLQATGLQPYLDALGFQLVGYGCATCIGNSGPLDPALEEQVTSNDLVVASVLSGNRNFEARVHQNVKANFLMSPPLVVAFALAGTVNIDFETEPIGKGADGADVFLRNIWPTNAEIAALLPQATVPETYQRLYTGFADQNPLWGEIPSSVGKLYQWDPESTYIQEPPFLTSFDLKPDQKGDVVGARALAVFGDSVTTDHISPAGAIKPNAPAGKYLQANGVAQPDFNSYGSRRGNDRIMTRGTFANVRIKNLLVPGVEGGVTVYQPDGEKMSIYDAAMKYKQEQTPLVIFGGYEYGTGSSRDWAAKGTHLLGVKAVIVRSFERIHRSNLVGMGVLPLQFMEGDSAQSLGLDGSETFDVVGIDSGIIPRQQVTLVIHRQNGSDQEVPLILRIDTPIEVEYFQNGGILPYVLRQLMP